MSQSGPPPPVPPSSAPGARKPDASKSPLGKRAYTFSLSFSKLLTAVIVALIGVSWVFMLGVMVGRGYNPDAKINEITGRVLRGRQTPAVQEPPQAVLRPEELNFGAALRDKPLHNSTAAVGASDVQTPIAQSPIRQTNSTASGVAGNATAVQTAPPERIAPQGAQSARFDVIYQVAAFRGAEQADRLRELLEGEGVRTNMEKSPAKDGKSLYKVLAVRRGTEEDDKQLLAVLERLKLGSPLLRSKKPVPGGEKGR
jgi:cell division septation protein DedD